MIPNTTERRRLNISAAAFICILLLLELGARWLTPRIALGETAEFFAKHAALRTLRADLLVLGDSAAVHGLVPAALADSRAYNAAISSGSGIVARELAKDVVWRPQHLIYAGVPLEVADTWELQRHERLFSRTTELWHWQHKSGELVLSRLCRFFGMRGEIRAALGQTVKHGIPSRTADRGASGFVALPLRPLSGEDVKRLMAAWFKRQEVTSSIRRQALVGALKAWSGPRTAISLIIMPLSKPLRASLAQRAERLTIWQGWLTAAEETHAALLDCSEAMPDDAFNDDNHLNGEGARLMSSRMRDWLDKRRAPDGCALLRGASEAIP